MEGEDGVVAREARIRGSVVGLDLKRLLEVLEGFLQTLFTLLSKEKAPLQVRLIGSRVDRTSPLELQPLLRGHLGLDLAGNGAGHLALQLQNVAQIAMVSFAPETSVARSVNQLRRDPHPVSRARDRAFHHGVDAELPGDLAQRLFSVLVLLD